MAELILSTEQNSEVKDMSTILPNPYLSNHRSKNNSSSIATSGTADRDELFGLQSPPSSKFNPHSTITSAGFQHGSQLVDARRESFRPIVC